MTTNKQNDIDTSPEKPDKFIFSVRQQKQERKRIISLGLNSSNEVT